MRRFLRAAFQRPVAMFSPARWITPSNPSSARASSTPASGSQRMPPAPGADRPRRAISWPPPARNGTTAPPTSPVAPVTSIFISAPLFVHGCVIRTEQAPKENPKFYGLTDLPDKTFGATGASKPLPTAIAILSHELLADWRRPLPRLWIPDQVRDDALGVRDDVRASGVTVRAFSFYNSTSEPFADPAIIFTDAWHARAV